MPKRTQNGQSPHSALSLAEKIAATPIAVGAAAALQPQLDLPRLLEELAIEGSAAEKGFEDTGKYDEARETHVRREIGIWAAYAEFGPSFDPDGKYLCGTCDMRLPPDECTHVSGEISFTAGSCRLYIHGPELEGAKPLPQKLTQIQAQYAERPEEKGFGCSRCEYGAEAKKLDAAGRKSWCTFWGVHVRPLACCAMEDGADMKEAPGE